jgi:hypothetical protein
MDESGDLRDMKEIAFRSVSAARARPLVAGRAKAIRSARKPWRDRRLNG